MPHEAILERLADHPNVVWMLDKAAQISTPASLTFVAGSIIKAVKELPAIPHHLTVIEAVTQIVMAGIYSIATVIGSLGVVLSVYMAGKWRVFRAETERIKTDHAKIKAQQDHEYRMAQLRSGEMDRIDSGKADDTELRP